MELFAKRMTWELDNDEGLSCLFFELEDGYFTLSRKTGAEALRLEMNDPANGQLIRTVLNMPLIIPGFV